MKLGAVATTLVATEVATQNKQIECGNLSSKPRLPPHRFAVRFALKSRSGNGRHPDLVRSAVRTQNDVSECTANEPHAPRRPGQARNSMAENEKEQRVRLRRDRSAGVRSETADKATANLAEEIRSDPTVHSAESIRGLGSNIHIRRGLHLWGSLFSLAESFNRRITFAAAFQMAEAQGLIAINAARANQGLPRFASSFDFAEAAVEDTQGIYNRGNRPNWARGPIGSVVFTFKQFSISYLEFFKRLPPKEKALAGALLILAAGVQGAPGADDLEDLIDTIGQMLGFNTNSKRVLREGAVRILGESLGGLLTHGVSGIPGVPIDVQGRLGFNNLIPGTALFKRREVDKVSEIAQVIGPLGGLLTQAQRGFTALEAKQYGQVVEQAAPVAIQNLKRGIDMWQTGAYHDVKGRKVIDTDHTDAVVKMLGIQPQDLAMASRKVQDMRQDVSMVRTVESGIADRWARGILDQDPGAVDAAIADLYAWNQRNETKIVITPIQIQSRVRQAMLERSIRVTKSAPREMRGRVFEGLQ